MSQKSLARLLGRHQSTISRWETGAGSLSVTDVAAVLAASRTVGAQIAIDELIAACLPPHSALRATAIDGVNES